jgi:hypothetical protein
VFNYCRLTPLLKIRTITTELHAIPIFLTNENNKILGSSCKLVISHIRKIHICNYNSFVSYGRPVGSAVLIKFRSCVLWQNLGQHLKKITIVPFHNLSNLHTLLGRAVAQRLDAGCPPRRPRFAYGQHVGFVVDKAALGQVFSEYFGFPCQSFHRFRHYHNHPGLTQ